MAYYKKLLHLPNRIESYIKYAERVYGMTLE